MPATYEDDIIKCIYIISVVTGATDGIGKEYARQVSDSSYSISNSSNAEEVDRLLDDKADDDGPVVVASERNSLID